MGAAILGLLFLGRVACQQDSVGVCVSHRVAAYLVKEQSSSKDPAIVLQCAEAAEVIVPETCGGGNRGLLVFSKRNSVTAWWWLHTDGELLKRRHPSAGSRVVRGLTPGSLFNTTHTLRTFTDCCWDR